MVEMYFEIYGMELNKYRRGTEVRILLDFTVKFKNVRVKKK
jgi:hypothetical protein